MSEAAEIIGRLIQSNSRGFRFACSQANVSRPRMGDLVRVDADPASQVYGVIANILWQSDDLTAQLAQAEQVSQTILAESRKGSQTIDVLMIGYRDAGLHHTLPPRPPSALEQIRLCQPAEIVQFTSASFTYLRLILEASEYPVADIIGSHLSQVHACQAAAGNPAWMEAAVDYLTGLLLEDYDRLMAVMEAVAARISVDYFVGS